MFTFLLEKPVMKKLATLASSARITSLLCASSAVLLAAAPAMDAAAAMITVTPSATTTIEAMTTPSAAYVVPTSAYNLYVAPTGSDSNPGTQAKPVKTIARATALASAGYI